MMEPKNHIQSLLTYPLYALEPSLKGSKPEQAFLLS